ncbi:large ribosomal subunit protein uL10c-like [Pyrus communis]|uniref:large ribosomal subunit protein uL10c-like n=1 Tax=Pyrus communis TaxID=23211 RepID=UPI0035BFE7CE
MEATLFSFPSSKPPSPSLTQTHPKSLLTRPSTNPFLSLTPRPTRRHHHHHRLSTIRSAISRTKKEQTVETIKENLENCHLMAGIRYKGLTVKQFQDLRKVLPETTKLIVAKNTLVYKAIEGTPWEALKPCMTGMNAWLFVHSEEIPPAIKPYRDFQKEKKLDSNDFTGAVFEGKFYGPGDFKQLETMPTRAEIYAKLLGTLNSPASSLVGTIQAPARELIMLLKAYVQKLEEEGGGGQ